jgi:DNA-binding transcriptional ArsR family regulator
MLDVPVSKSTLSHHLKVLRHAGLTHTRAQGVQRFVSLRTDDIEALYPGLLGCVLGYSRRRLRSTADRGP